MKTLTLGGALQLDDLGPLVDGQRLRLKVPAAALAGLKDSRAMVEDAVRRGEVVYGLTTGFGKLKNQAVAREDLRELQRNLVLSHCVGGGEAMPLEEARLVVLLRIVSLLRGVSGVRPALVRRLVRVVPCTDLKVFF